MDSFGFYEVLLNMFVEENPYNAFIQLWVGGIIGTALRTPIWIKQSTNVQIDPGYICLDGVVDVSKWHGWLPSRSKLVHKITKLLTSKYLHYFNLM